MSGQVVDTETGEIVAGTSSELAEHASYTATALYLPEGLTFEQWAEMGGALQRIARSWQWWLGDWLNYGEQRYGEKYTQAIERTGLEEQALMDISWAARSVEISRRRENLSFGHHREVAPLAPPDQDAWLDKAEADQLTVHQLRKAIRTGDDGDEWFTPEWLFNGLGLRFSIDVCAPRDRTHSAVPADTFYTADDDGLAQPWHGTVWCNPPYSDPEGFARRMVGHGDGLLLCHMPMNAEWCVEVWHACDGLRLFQGIEFVRPDGSIQRPGYWLQLAAFGGIAAEALANLHVPPEVAENPRRVPSPMWKPETA